MGETKFRGRKGEEDDVTWRMLHQKKLTVTVGSVTMTVGNVTMTVGSANIMIRGLIIRLGC